MTSSIAEDYLERIYELIQEKGYARVVDLADRLNVTAPSVTKMIQNLDEQGFVQYERYRGVILTSRGEEVAKAIKDRHAKLEEFFHILGIGEETLLKDIEGIEHHLSPITLSKLTDLVQFFNSHPDLLQEFWDFSQENP